MVPFAGYEMPVRYTTDLEEHMCVRNNVGIFDVSHMGEILVKGEQAEKLLQYVTSNDVAKLEKGNVQYAYLPNTENGVVDDITVYKLTESTFMLVVNASNIEKDYNWIKSNNQQFGATLEDISDKTCLFAVQGPKALDTVQKITSYDLRSITYYHFATVELSGIENIIISNTGYTGAGGFEIYVDKKYAAQLWNAIITAGKEFGIQPIGLGARDTLRLEMGFCLYGNDINDETSPLEAGLGWVTKFNKSFINDKGLLKQKEQGINKKLVGFKMLEKGIARHGYEIFDQNNEKIGTVTSGTISPVLGYGIGLGYVDKKYAETGSVIFIKIREKALQAEVVKPPFIKK